MPLTRWRPRTLSLREQMLQELFSLEELGETYEPTEWMPPEVGLRLPEPEEPLQLERPLEPERPLELERPLEPERPLELAGWTPLRERLAPELEEAPEIGRFIPPTTPVSRPVARKAAPPLPAEVPVVRREKELAVPFWQRALQVFTAPFQWVDETLIKP